MKGRGEAAGPGEGKTGPLPFGTGKAHQARVYDYYLGGYFLYTHASERVRYPSEAVAVDVRAARVRGGDFRANS